jgi:hypothetical protein
VLQKSPNLCSGPRSRTGGIIHDGAERLSRNVGNYRPTDAAWHHKRGTTSTTPRRNSEIRTVLSNENVGVAIRLYHIYIREVCSSNVDGATAVPTFSILTDKCWDITRIRPCGLWSISLRVHHQTLCLPPTLQVIKDTDSVVKIDQNIKQCWQKKHNRRALLDCKSSVSKLETTRVVPRKYSQDLTFVIFSFLRRNDQYVHPTRSAVRDFGCFRDCLEHRDKVQSISVLLLL